jgi:hypothetical protein
VPPPLDPKDAYASWHDPSRHVRLLAFASPDGAEVTIVAMNRIEGDVTLEVSLAGLGAAASKPFVHHRTTRSENGRRVEETRATGGKLRVTLPEASIVTLTTLR